MMRAYLKAHPSAEAGLVRADQAWQYLRLVKSRGIAPPGSAVLSSDLEEATDHFPFGIIEQALTGLLEGLRLAGPALNLALETLLTGRLCYADDIDEVWTSSRGIFMGEPLAKIVLTVVNMAAEEIAMRRFLNYDFDKPIQVPWRSLSVAGDDHIARGPVPYLRLITETHKRMGNKVSKAKHGISTRHVVYCEKVLEVPALLDPSPWTINGINDSVEGYQLSPFVDSVKVRLLSPVTVPRDILNEKNTAIGKAIGLGNTIRWLKPEQFSTKWRAMVRDRLFQRMGNLLPDRSSGLYWVLQLPQELGGLGTFLNEEIETILSRLPPPHRTLLRKMADNEAKDDVVAAFRGLCKNTSVRGYTIPETDADLIKECVRNALSWITPMELRDACNLHGIDGNLNFKKKESLLVQKGIYTLEAIVDRVTRPVLFQDIIEKKAITRTFRTEPFKKRYAILWDLVEPEEVVLVKKDFWAAKGWGGRAPVYRVADTKMEIPVFGKIREVDILEEVTLGLPDLRIRWTELCAKY